VIVSEKRTVIHTYQSEIIDEVRTLDKALAPVIEWADGHPLVYRICMENRSRAWGNKSTKYLACEHGSSPDAILSRIRAFRRYCEADFNPVRFETWSARHTFAIYEHKDFRSGYIKQFDGKYDRGCAYVDYTRKTLDEVVQRFRAWCGNMFETRAILLNDEVVWEGCNHDKSRKRNSMGLLMCNDCGREIAE
jgi:hypothetical protein